MKKLSLIVLILCSFLQGCYNTIPNYNYNYDYTASVLYNANYDIKLTDTQSQVDNSNIPSIDTVGNNFKDKYINISFKPGPEGVEFRLENINQNSIKVIWDNVVFIFPNKTTSRVIHSGIKYIDKNSALPLSVIPRDARLEDQILPSANIYYDKNAGWKTDPVFECDKFVYDNKDLEEFKSTLLNNVGKTYKVVLPVEISGSIIEYSFTFKVKSFKLTRP